MDIKKLKHINKKKLKLYEAGIKALEQQNPQYAIDMLRSFLRDEPGVLEVRQKLREIELGKIDGEISPIKKILAKVLSLPAAIMVPSQIGQEKFNIAMDNAEAAIARDPTSKDFYFLLAKASEAADLLPITQMALESSLKFNRDCGATLDWLARIYCTLGIGNKAIECRERHIKLTPSDTKLKDALEKTTQEIESDAWNPEELDFDESAPPQPQANLGHSDREQMEKQVHIQQKNVEQSTTSDSLKKMGDLYTLAQDYDNAVASYNKIFELTPNVDASVDKAMTDAMSLQFDKSIIEWQNYLKDNELSEEERQDGIKNAKTATKNKVEMIIQRAKDRVERNPHALGNKFELGKVLCKYKRYDIAINNLEQTKGTAQFKLQSLFMLGKSYLETNSAKKAVEMINAAVDLMPRMCNAKKEAYYLLAKAHESLGEKDISESFYKRIYAADDHYRDVGLIIDKIYQRDLY